MTGICSNVDVSVVNITMKSTETLNASGVPGSLDVLLNVGRHVDMLVYVSQTTAAPTHVIK